MNNAAGCLFFLPIILFFGFFGILVVGFIALVIYLVNKGKQDAWTGKLIDKIGDRAKKEKGKLFIEKI